jgi:hypothetical protein
VTPVTAASSARGYVEVAIRFAESNVIPFLKEDAMKRKVLRGAFGSGLLVLATLILVFGLTAGGPKRNTNPNGFPSGEHYNLNIIGKKAEFACPEPEVDEGGNIVYGNVIFVPQEGTGIQIVMQSGRKGTNKTGTVITDLWVIDPCTAPFDGNEAVLQLPANPYGYDAYARALATPTDEPNLEVTSNLLMVEDELGDPLVWLGIVYQDGIFTKQSQTFTRSKGKSTAVDITDLFMWSGTICYDAECDLCVPTAFCRDDATGALTPKTEDTCPAGSTEVVLYCRTYATPTWVFNIGDFVNYLWSVNNNGVKLIQVRFYPRYA